MSASDASVVAYRCEITAGLWLGHLLAVEEDCLSLCINKSIIKIIIDRYKQNDTVDSK